MQLRYARPALQGQDGIAKVTAIAWAPNNRRFAAVTTDRVVHLFDENGERRDKFSTKPAEANGPKNFLVRGMAFSPDSTKVAIAQSDCITYVYKLGLDWGDKKSICNKFPQSAPVTAVKWPVQHPNELFFASADGKVRAGQIRSNKSGTLYSHPDGSPAVSLAVSSDGSAIASGHADGAIYRYILDDGGGNTTAMRIAQHSCVPTALSWGQALVAAGTDCKPVLYDGNGTVQQQFNYGADETVREFTSASFNPSGDTVVLGSFSKLHVFTFNGRKGAWEEAAVKAVDNLYTVTSLAWKPDGSRLTTGGLCGNVDLYDACVRKHKYKGQYELTYVSNSQVIVKRLSTGASLSLRSNTGLEITKLNIHQDVFVIARTRESLLLGQLDTCKMSEIPWRGSGNEKFLLENPQVCMIFNAGELSLTEYGSNDVLGTCRTEFVSPFLISVRLSETAASENKKIAHLIDPHTIRVLDLVSGVTAASINHESKVDWLELNPKATHLLFRDKKKQVHLFDLAKQERTTLLDVLQLRPVGPRE